MKMNKWNKKITLILLICVLLLAIPCPVYAADAIVGKITGLGDFLKKVVQAAGVIILIFGIMTFGAGWLGHDTTQQWNGLRVIIGGLFMAGAGLLLTLLQ